MRLRYWRLRSKLSSGALTTLAGPLLVTAPIVITAALRYFSTPGR
ncbi:hypothetical protein AB0C65_28810 [Nocardia sp. NPDC048505]